jgi:hypothetical protein
LRLQGRLRQKITFKRCFGAARLMKSRYKWPWFDTRNAAARKDKTVVSAVVKLTQVPFEI